MDIKPRHSDRGSILKKIRRRFLYRPSPESRPDQAAQNNRNRMPGYILIGILAAISLTDVWLCYAYIDILSGLYLRNVASESICGIVCLLIEISIVRGGKNSRSSIYFFRLIEFRYSLLRYSGERATGCVPVCGVLFRKRTET